MPETWLAFIAALVVGVTVALWLRARGEVARLRERVEASTRELQNLQNAFARFAPESLVERIIEGGIPTGGEQKEVTVLFADLVSFTALAERVEAPVLVDIVNGYFEHMSRAITDHAGHVSTFIGDGILALFGALDANPWQGNDAAHAALAMRRALETYNDQLEAKGLPRLRIGVGLHRGTGVAGLVGSHDKKEFAIVGRTVNVAARAQGLTREHGVDVLLTDDLRRTLDPRFRVRALEPATLRGIQGPVQLYALEAFDEAAEGQSTPLR